MCVCVCVCVCVCRSQKDREDLRGEDETLKEGILDRISITVKQHHKQGNLYKEAFNFEVQVNLGSRVHDYHDRKHGSRQAGRHGTEEADGSYIWSTNMRQGGERERGGRRKERGEEREEGKRERKRKRGEREKRREGERD